MTKEILELKLENKQNVLVSARKFLNKIHAKDELFEMDLKVIKLEAQINLLKTLISECE